MDSTELRLRVFEKVYDAGTARVEGPEGLVARLDAALAWVTTEQPAAAKPEGQPQTPRPAARPLETVAKKS